MQGVVSEFAAAWLPLACAWWAWSLAVWAMAMLIQSRYPSPDWDGYWLAAIAVAVLPAVGTLGGVFGNGSDGAPLALMPVLSASPLLADGPSEALAAPPSAWVASSMTAAALLYLVVALLGAARVVYQYQCLRRNLRDCRLPDEVAPEALAAALGYRVVIAGWRLPPLALGVCSPLIVIPLHVAHALSPARLQLVIRHEAAHINRHDPQTTLLLQLVRALCWPSPAVRAMVRRWALACEMQADAAVLRHFDVGSPGSNRGHGVDANESFTASHYASTLVSVARINSGRALPCPSATLINHHFRSVQMRVRCILEGAGVRRKPIAARVSLLLGALALGSGALGGLAWAGSIDGAPMLVGRITSAFGPVKAGGKFHHGVDIAAPLGTPILSPVTGTVTAATDLFNDTAAWGKVVVIDADDGLSVMFAHLQSYRVTHGDRVEVGQVLGRVGNTGVSSGPHVHVETRRNGERMDPSKVFSAVQLAGAK